MTNDSINGGVTISDGDEFFDARTFPVIFCARLCCSALP